MSTVDERTTASSLAATTHPWYLDANNAQAGLMRLGRRVQANLPGSCSQNKGGILRRGCTALSGGAEGCNDAVEITFTGNSARLHNKIVVHAVLVRQENSTLVVVAQQDQPPSAISLTKLYPLLSYAAQNVESSSEPRNKQQTLSEA